MKNNKHTTTPTIEDLQKRLGIAKKMALKDATLKGRVAIVEKMISKNFGSKKSNDKPQAKYKVGDIVYYKPILRGFDNSKPLIIKHVYYKTEDYLSEGLGVKFTPTYLYSFKGNNSNLSAVESDLTKEKPIYEVEKSIGKEKSGGRGWGDFKTGKPITKIKDFEIGKLYLNFNKQFNSNNIVLITGGDETGLNRAIVYGSFVRPNNLKGKEEHFAIWEHELKNNVFFKAEEKNNNNTDVSNLKNRIKDYVYSIDKTILKDFDKRVKTLDLQAFKELGVKDDLVMAFYCGVRSIADFKGDVEMSGLDGLYGYSDLSSMEKVINRAITNCKKRAFEIGLKYPNFDWKKIIEKYNILETKIIKQRSETFNNEYQDHLYEIFIGEHIVVGHKIGRDRYKNEKLHEEVRDENEIGNPLKVSSHQKQHDSRAGFNGGYFGLVSSNQDVILDIIKKLSSQSESYVKDFSIIINDLGGIGHEELDLNKIKYEHGGGVEKHIGQSVIINANNLPYKLEGNEDRFLNTEIVLEEKTRNGGFRGFVRETGEKVPMELFEDDIEQYAEGGEVSDITEDLKNFDLDDLDAFEQQQYDHFIKSSTKEEALQILINTVEGDYTQLSQKLSEIAEKQYSTEQCDKDTYEKHLEDRGSFANGGSVTTNNKTWIVNIAMPTDDNNMPRLRKEEIVLGRLSNEFDVKQAILRKSDDWLKNGQVLSIYEKKENGGSVDNEIVREMGLHDAVIYNDKTHYITEQNGVVGLINFKQGAYGSDYPFIPLVKIRVDDEVRDMMGRKVHIPYSYKNGGKVLNNDYFTSVNHWVYFTLNYNPNFMDAFGGDSHIKKHLDAKFINYYNDYGTYGVMNKFWVELDGENRASLAKWVKKNYTGTPKPTVSDDEYEKMINHWVYFTKNYPQNFMDAFGGDSHIKNHLQEKFHSYYDKYGTYSVMNKFFVELDAENQKLLANWARDNYKGTKMADGGEAVLVEEIKVLDSIILPKDLLLTPRGVYEIIKKGNIQTNEYIVEDIYSDENGLKRIVLKNKKTGYIHDKIYDTTIKIHEIINRFRMADGGEAVQELGDLTDAFANGGSVGKIWEVSMIMNPITPSEIEHPKHQKRTYNLGSQSTKFDVEQAIKREGINVMEILSITEKYKCGGSVDTETVLDWVEENDIKLLKYYLPNTPTNQVFNQSDLKRKGDYVIQSKTSEDGSEQAFIDICFGDKYEESVNELVSNYDSFIRYAQKISDGDLLLDVSALSSEDNKTIMFLFTNQQFKDGGSVKDENQEFPDFIRNPNIKKFAVFMGGRIIGELAYTKDINDLINNKLLKRQANWELIKYKDENGKTVRITRSYLDDGMTIPQVIDDYYTHATEEDLEEEISVLNPKGGHGNPITRKGYRYFEEGGSIKGNLWGVEVRETNNSPFEQKAENLSKEDAETLAKELYSSGKYYQVIAEIPIFKKGGSLKSIENKVAEVNRLISLAVDSKGKPLQVVDKSGSWQSPMIYKPLKYSNGTLYIEYDELDLYKHNKSKGVVSYWETKKEKVLKRDMENDSPLNDITKMYRRVLKENYIDYEKFENGGSVEDRTALSEEEKQFVREESQNSGQGFTYRAKVLHGAIVVLKERNGNPVQKWSVDNFDIAKKIADRLNKTKMDKGGSAKQSKYNESDYEDARSSIMGMFDDAKFESSFTKEDVEGLAVILNKSRVIYSDPIDVWESNEVNDYLSNLEATYRIKEGKMSKGGSAKPKQWIQKATKQMDKKGTEGLFTKKAKLKGLTPVEYAKHVLSHPKKHTIKTREEAQFFKNANKELF